MRTARILILVTMLGAGLAAPAGAAVIAYEPFGGGPLPTIDGAGSGWGWSGPWQDLAGAGINTGIALPGLVHPGLPTAGGAAVTPPSPTLTDYLDYSRALAPYDMSGGKAYISFLFRPDANYGSYGGVQIGTYPRQIQIGAIPGYYLYGLRIGHYGFYPSNVPEIEGQRVFVVFALHVDAPAQQTQFRLYIDPPVGGTEPLYPQVTTALAGLFALPTAVDLVTDGGVTIDEIRVGTTWASVTAALGDMNCDGAVNFDDIDPFVLALGGQAGYAAHYPQCRWLNGDCDDNGTVDFDDIDAFVAALSQ